MQRSLLPNVLASLGLFIILLTPTMPLFEWKISKEVANFPSTYEVYFSPSPWTTKFGELLDNKSYIFRQQVFVSDSHGFCVKEGNFNLSVARLPNEKTLELVSLYIYKSISWMALGSLGVVVFSGVYIWWITIWLDHRPISEAVISTMLGSFFFIALIAALMIVQPVLSIDYFVTSNNCTGMLKLSASLSRFHYETPITLISGIFAELGSSIIMLRQITNSLQRKKSSMPAAG